MVGLAVPGAVPGLLTLGRAVFPAEPLLVVWRGALPVAVLPLRPGEEVALRFIHSVDGLPVEDRYAATRDRGLVQTETRLLSFGAGTGLIPGQGTPVLDGPWLRVVGMNRPIGRLALRVGSARVGHTLLHRGCGIPLSERWPGQRLVMEAVWVPAWLHGLVEQAARALQGGRCPP